MKRRSLFLALGIILAMPFADGQDVAIGQWKDYLSYYRGIKISQGQGSFYCTTSSGIFSYNTQDNSITRYNKITGLSDIGITVARYISSDNTLFIGYSDGNIDLVQNKQVINIPDLKNNMYIIGSKAINDVYFYNGYAYVSCGQGILQVDINLDVIKNSFYIGPANGAVNVHGLTILSDTLFAASDLGIYKISMNDRNMNDYTHWQKVVNSTLHAGRYTNITAVGNTIFTSFHIPASFDTLFQYNNGVWSHYSYTQGGDVVNALESCNGYLVITNLYDVKVVNSSAVLVKDISSYGFAACSANDAVLDANMNLWIADNSQGMVESGAQATGQAFYPAGPYNNNIFSVTLNSNNVWITSGAYDNTDYASLFHSYGISVEYNNAWYNITPSSGYIFDLNCVVVDPTNPAHAYAGSYINGVVECNLPNITKVYDSADGLQPFGPAHSNRIAGVAYDTLGNLWVSNGNASSGSYISVRKKTDGKWYSFNFIALLPTSPVNLQGNPGGVPAVDLMVTQSGAKWVILPKVGILVYQDNGTFAAPSATNSILITDAKGHGALPSLNIYAMVQDKDGAVWVGTDQQVVVFYNPDNVLDGLGDWDAQNVYVIQNTYTQYLMQSQTTTSIAVDGANRKWIGTQSGGVFLMSADGTQQINNFTASNSPLLSNTINCISVNPLNGEVFFGTDQGLVSYRGTATEGTTNFGNVYAFPNPVTHDYTGTVAINGLVTNADVKITDVNGEIVYHTIALGGQAIWDGNSFNGQRVKTGVYLIFCSSPDGSQSRVAKLLFIN